LKKVHLIYLSVIAVLFTSTLVLIYLNYLKPQPTSPPTTGVIPTETPDPTADWKTYENKELGYSFKYPSKYTFVNGGIFDDEGYNVYTFRVQNNPNYLNLLNFELERIKESQNSEDILMAEGYTSPFVEDDMISSKVQELNLPNLGKVYFRKNGPYKVDIDVALWLKDDKVYYFSAFSEKNNLEEYNQILSTFKFISQENVASDEQNLTKVLQSLIYPKSPEKVKIIPTIKDNFASGTYRIVLDAEGGGPGGVWIAAKSDGNWILVEAFQEPPSCQLMKQYNVPVSIYGSCIDK